MDKKGNLIPNHRLKPQNDEKGLKPQIDKRGLKPQNDMPQQCLMQNPYWICKYDRNLVMMQMEIFIMQMSFMRMQMQM